MSIRVISCLRIVCDSCGKDPSDFNDEGWSPHFASLDDAVAQLGGDDDESTWLMTPREHICPNCRAKQTCALVGHHWGDWFTGDARGIPMKRRGCWRCSHSEMALAEGTGAPTDKGGES